MKILAILALLLISTTVFGLTKRKISPETPLTKNVLAETDSTQFLNGEGWRYGITAHHSVLCLDIVNGDRSEGARLIQWGCTSASNQDFRIYSGGGGYFEIVSLSSGLCLAVANRNPGAPIIQKKCDKSGEALWYFKNIFEYNYYIINHVTGYAMDVSGASYEWGAPIIAYPLTYSINQRFKLWPRVNN